MNTRPARTQAIARQDEQIQQNVAKIEEGRRRPTSALGFMAMRLGVSEGNLSNTLKSTVFKNCSDAEFVALVIVANEYKLNPLTKEIYAFPVKGGGIAPMVSIDGWVRIMNEHPQFDGIEFNDIADDNGNIFAIESVIWRKDRMRPIKVTEYLDECKRNSDPWNKSPNRMLRHRALMQGARYAFGFSGIHSEDDAEVQVIGEPVTARNVSPPTRQQIAHDPATGEIIEGGRTDEQHGDQHTDDDEQTARELDARQDAERDGFTVDDGVQDWGPTLEQVEEELAAITTVIDLNSYWSRTWPMFSDAPEDVAGMALNAKNARAAELSGKK